MENKKAVGIIAIIIGGYIFNIDMKQNRGLNPHSITWIIPVAGGIYLIATSKKKTK